MLTTGAVRSGKVVSLESLRPNKKHLSVADRRCFEEVLASAERQATGEVVPFPCPGTTRQAARLYADPMLDSEDLEEFLDKVQDRLEVLEHGLLSLEDQISALLRCL